MQGIQVKKRISGWWYVAIWGVYIILASTIGSALSVYSGTEVTFEWILFLLVVLGSIILKVARSDRVKANVTTQVTKRRAMADQQRQQPERSASHDPVCAW